MSVDPSYFDSTNGGLYGPDLSGNTNVSDPYGAGNINYTDPMSGMGGETSPTGGYVDTGGGNGSPASSGAGSLLASFAAKLLGPGASPQNMALLSQLLGQGVNGAAGFINSAAAKNATQQFANQTHFNPYNVSTASGNTSFNGNNVSSTLAPGQQANLTGLNNLNQSSFRSLQAGPAAAANQYYQQLQAQQKQGNDRFMANNADSQFGRGILASTAGQYQTQGAVDSIHNQNLQDATLANNFAQGQQQQQLAQLTAGLNGGNQITQNQLAQMGTGGTLGYDQSRINLGAYAPLANANANSPVGSILSSLGTQYNNSQYPQYPVGPRP